MINKQDAKALSVELQDLCDKHPSFKQKLQRYSNEQIGE